MWYRIVRHILESIKKMLAFAARCTFGSSSCHFFQARTLHGAPTTMGSRVCIAKPFACKHTFPGCQTPYFHLMNWHISEKTLQNAAIGQAPKSSILRLCNLLVDLSRLSHKAPCGDYPTQNAPKKGQLMSTQKQTDDHAELRPLLRRGFQSRGFGHPCWELGTAK